MNARERAMKRAACVAAQTRLTEAVQAVDRACKRCNQETRRKREADQAYAAALREHFEAKTGPAIVAAHRVVQRARKRCDRTTQRLQAAHAALGAAVSEHLAAVAARRETWNANYLAYAAEA
jgi:hypothetical protein